MCLASGCTTPTPAFDGGGETQAEAETGGDGEGDSGDGDGDGDLRGHAAPLLLRAVSNHEDPRP
ncbi:hypothetical protein ENSA5_30640 [Enhygromyxa salina]|uniref:Uncharacterized protein n=1 Tax=Enhygromyxa salina TaxID=215803 RepID=A0A2S9XZ07_9BACT|nr:hypothetical protein [Enhygromyxa salina]PRP98079.1 hypothetical protein ENSA5_30640 [Enhygromyxa salina]